MKDSTSSHIDLVCQREKLIGWFSVRTQIPLNIVLTFRESPGYVLPFVLGGELEE
jgi:hypothetical protein